jgi:alkylation response protein AidB-like acyl-CoA dehydrogenase
MPLILTYLSNFGDIYSEGELMLCMGMVVQIERYLRDLRVHMILEGTNEIMRVVIGRHMTKGRP